MLLQNINISRFTVRGFMLGTILACTHMLSILPIAYAAQDPVDYEKTPVHLREHPAFSPDDIIMGSFIVRPILATMGWYDSNVFLDKDDHVADKIVSVRPSLSIRSDFSRHAVNLDMDADATRYVQESEQNTYDVKLFAQGRLDITSDLRSFLSFNVIEDHEDRNDSTVPSSPEKPTELKQRDVEIAVNYTPARLNLTLFGRYKINKFENGIRRNSQTAFIAEDRNKRVIDVGTRVAYDAHPNYTPYFLIRYSDERYDHLTFQENTGGFTGREQDVNTYSASPGISFNFKDLIMGRLEAGMAFENAVDEGTDDKKTYVIDSEITYNPTKLTTIVAGLERNFDTDSDTNFGTVVTESNLSVHHELRRNFIVGLGAQSKWRNFDNSARLDRIYSMTLDSEYKINKHLSISGEYIFNRRLSETTNFDYAQHLFYVGLKNKF